jgi:hypothetical protein
VVGGQVDATHPAAVAWLAAGAAAHHSPAHAPSVADLDFDVAAGRPLAPDALEAVRDDAVARFGSLEKYAAVASTARLAAEALIARRRDQALAGRLISREFVRAYLVAPIDSEFRRLLGDAARTIGAQVPGMVHAGATREAVTAFVTTIHSRSIVSLVSRLARALERAPAAESPPPIGERPARIDARRAIDPSLLTMIAHRLADVAAPAVVDAVGRAIGRAAAGKAWNGEAFDDAMGLLPGVRNQAVHDVAMRLTAHVDAVIRDHALGAPTTETTHAEV